MSTKNIVKAYARAKINFVLDILGKRPDGYHQVEMVMQSIGLYDQLEFTPEPEKITLTVPGGEVSEHSDNLVYQAASLLRSSAGINLGVKIKLIKNIPVEAGLGGGSADAAATLTILNNMWGTDFTLQELMLLGEKLGSDIPFCLLGGTALARGRGEKLEAISPCPRLGLVLVKPPFGVSTASVYHAYKPELVLKKPLIGAMINAINEKNVDGLIMNLGNVLEPVTTTMHPELIKIKERLLEAGALGALMSGSGPTVFGIAPSLKDAYIIAGRYRNFGELVMVTETYNEN